MEFVKDGRDRSGWLERTDNSLNDIHIVDTMPDFHYTQSGLKSMYMDVIQPQEDHRLNRSSKTGLLLRNNETISGPCSLSTGGIAGARVPPLYKYTNRGAHAFSSLPKTWEDLPRSTPKCLIPESVSRPSNILNAKDIEGTTPKPKNMKLGKDARNTNPMDPRYILPSYAEPFIKIPKFLRNSLDVGDIEGARPSSRCKEQPGRCLPFVADIEGSQPGWKPFHRRQFGKEGRDLCLRVEDINGPIEQRVTRPPTAEVYGEIEGSHSRGPAVGRASGIPRTTSLRTDDIEGANAGSSATVGITRRRKEFAKCHAQSLKEHKDAEELALDILTTKLQDQLRTKGLQPKDVAASFQQLDRQSSGKLDMNELKRVLETLNLDVDHRDLSSISRSFVHPTGDGFFDYRKLLKHLVPVRPQQRGLQRDVSENVARSVNQGMDPYQSQKACYDSAWIADLVAKRDCRVSDGEGGTQLQPFNSGRPIEHARYLKEPPSNHAAQAEKYPKPQIKIIHEQAEPLKDFHMMAPEPISSSDCGRDVNNTVAREIPVLSVLPEPVTQPTWANNDTMFQDITKCRPRKVRGREESLFSQLKSPDCPSVPDNANSVPLFYKLRGMDKYETKHLPIGGPFWPGVEDVPAEDLAPSRPKTPTNSGPLPIHVPFLSGVERPQSAPRISLRRDYPVPPLFSEVNSEINLRKAGQKEKVLRTWVDKLGDGPSATTFVGEGDHVLSGTGMLGSSFIRPSSAILPHRYDHQSAWKDPEEQIQTATSLAHSCPRNAWSREETNRPQTVNSVVRGSPADNYLSTSVPRKLVSAMKRPSTAQSVASNARSVVTFSPFPSRPSTPCRVATPSMSPNVAYMNRVLRKSIQTRAQLHGQPHRSSRGIPVSRQRQQAQLREDMECIRQLV